MGILASGTLPSGVQLSNVYMCFHDESIYVKSNPALQILEYTVCYKVFADPSKQGDCIVRVPFQLAVPIEKDSERAFDVVYNHLKSLYPGSIDVFEPLTEKEVPIST
jgi:hypothetical protein